MRAALKPSLRWRGRTLERRELRWLALGLGACLLLFAFIGFAGEVMEGDFQALDVQILSALRDATDPSQPIGPAWLEYAMLDLTALGGSTVLGLVVCVVVGYLLLQGKTHTALMVALTSISGEVASAALKEFFMRPRPSIVPHLREVVSPSFPSGHAMESAIIYLTLAAMLMRASVDRRTKLYWLSVAVVLTSLVGISRVYLGVHYPTDVIGGWIFGFMWASICWLVARRLEPLTGVAEERQKEASGR
jgi:undecaprenyl-diphosphatase